ncbi:MAG: group III truncated hemoglobin [Verrucomicrobiota bacterium]
MTQLPGDIRNEDDIRKLVDSFYEKVKRDELLSPIFNDVAKVDWNEHLPLLYTFWSALLFQTKNFKGQPFPKHAVLPVERTHFTRWISLFVKTVDENFAGPKAEEAKNFGRSIADTFQLRMGLVDFPGLKLEPGFPLNK